MQCFFFFSSSYIMLKCFFFPLWYLPFQCPAYTEVDVCHIGTMEGQCAGRVSLPLLRQHPVQHLSQLRGLV